MRALHASGALQVLVVVHSMCWGLATPAQLVVLMDTQYYDGAEHRYADYAITDILQMIGRACRPLVDDTGKCVLLCHAARRRRSTASSSTSLSRSSRTSTTSSPTTCARRSSPRPIENKQDAVDYLTWSFMYRRLTQNPNYYNLQGATHRHLSDHLSELVESTLADLEQARCVTIDDDVDVSPLNLGMIASYYYIQYTTVELFASSLQPTTKTKGLLEIIASAAEFDAVPVRHREDGVLQNLAAHCAQAIAEPRYNDPHTKVNVLLQCHFGRTDVGREMAADLAGILEKGIRLLQATVDVIFLGLAVSALSAMELSQMPVQGMWERDSALLQLPHFTPALAKACAAAGVEGVFDLMEMEDDERTALLAMSPGQIADVARVANRYPSIDLSFEVEDEDEVASGDGVTVVVSLQREGDEEQKGAPKVAAPRFPKEKEEGWWLVIGDVQANALMCIKRITLQAKAKVKLDFVAPDPGEYNYKLFLMCDSYLGCDQEYDLPLKVGEAMEESGEEEEEEEEEG